MGKDMQIRECKRCRSMLSIDAQNLADGRNCNKIEGSNKQRRLGRGEFSAKASRSDDDATPTEVAVKAGNARDEERPRTNPQ